MFCLCPICRHPRRKDIDEELGRHPALLPIAAQFGVAHADLAHHHHVCCAPPEPPAIETVPAGPERVHAAIARAHAGTTWAMRQARRALNTTAARRDALRAAAQDARNAALEAALFPVLKEAETRMASEEIITWEQFKDMCEVIYEALRDIPGACVALADAMSVYRFEPKAPAQEPQP